MSAPIHIAALFKEHAPYLWRVLRRLGVAEADADDVCQEVFLVAHRNQASFRGESTPRTWLYGISVRLAADHRKRAHIRNERSVANPPEQRVEAAQHATLESRQARDVLDKALAALDDDRRAVFVLYEIEDLTLQEIADCLQVPLQTVFSRLKSGRQQITSVFSDTFKVDVENHAHVMEGG